MDIFINKSWAKYQKVFIASPEYEILLNIFLNLAFSIVVVDVIIYCPCKMCVNRNVHGSEIMYQHLKLNGMDKCYAQSRVHHGEVEQSQSSKTSFDTHVHSEAST